MLGKGFVYPKAVGVVRYIKDELNGRKVYKLEDKVKKIEQKYKAKKTRLNNIKKSGSRNERAKFYSTREWLSLRFETLSKYGHKCMSCGVDRTKAEIHVDHIIPISKNWALRYRSSNLQVLCRECNIGKRNWSQKDLRPLAEKE